MRTRLWRAPLCGLACVLWLTAACAGHHGTAPLAEGTSSPIAPASTPSGQSVGSGAAPSGARKTYVADSRTKVELGSVVALTWPPDLSNVAVPAECLRRKQPLARTCRYPATALRRLSEILDDAYQASHPDPEQLSCEATKKAEDKDRPSLTLADKRRALDENLAELEGCTELVPGFVRALRAHEDPKCADALAEIPLEASVRSVGSAPARAKSSSRPTATEPQPIDDYWRDLLYGQALAAVLNRWFRHPVQHLDSADSSKIEAWRARVLLPYLERGRTQLERARRAVEQLPDGSNGRAVAEQALWQAELRLVGAARMVQIPAELKSDYPSRSSFYGAFDALTQPLTEARERHRLSDCLLRAEHGLLDDAPFFWEQPASASQGEPRCSRFTQLPLPFPLAPRRDPRRSNDPILRLATTLPPAFVDAVLSDARRTDSEVHRALLTRGAPRSVRQFASAALAAGRVSAARNHDLHLALARAEFRLGLVYFAPESLERAKAELELAPDTGETRLLAALSATLLTARPKPSPDSSHGSCLDFDTSALRNFRNRSPSEAKDLIAIAGAALARLALECPENDYVQNAHTMLEQAEAGGAYYVVGCWHDQMLDARPFFAARPLQCGDPRSYPCLTIPWQGR